MSGVSSEMVRFTLVYKQNTKKLCVDWGATREKLKNYYKSRYESGDWRTSEYAMALAGIDREVERIRRRYYRDREKKRQEVRRGIH
jgi:hypothetical protein